MRSIPEILAEELGRKLKDIENVIALMDEGNIFQPENWERWPQ